ncbi:DUF4251 domain-containing protein [Spongiimicrobium salis]|uniref:DUF4251 domain-containing protein n=1 Tax=Spongiimicrobium salis TaxID=1667022 RepID=UPI00374D1B8C
MKKKYILVVFVLFGLLGTQAQSRSERKKERKEKKAAAYEETKALVTEGAFFFRGDWAHPLGGQRISLINNYNELKLQEGNLKAFFPYFGVVHRLGRYPNNGGGIQFELPVEESDYAMEIDDEKRRILISFSVENDSEFFNVTMAIYGEGRTFITVASSNRQSIKYNGKILPLPKES